MSTSLEIIQDVLDRLCVRKDVDTIDSSDDTQRQMLALLNEEGKELTATYDWQELVRETVTAAQDDSSKFADQGSIEELCPGFARICNHCIYLDGRSWPLVGPLSVTSRTYSKAGGMSFLFGYYIQEGHLFITQPTSSSQSLRIAYITRNWVQAADGTMKSKTLIDTDVPLLDDRLLTLGVVWRWLSRNGLPYQQEWLNYNSALVEKKANDAPHAVLQAGGGPRRYNPRRSIVGGNAQVYA